MLIALRYNFPDDRAEERTRVFDKIDSLLAAQTVEAAEEALSLHRKWLERYPDDYAALDTGGHMLMYYEALLATQGRLETPALALR